MKILDLNDSVTGNAFALLGLSKSWAKQLGVPEPDLTTSADDYNHLLDNFDAAWKGKVSYRFENDPRDSDARIEREYEDGDDGEHDLDDCEE